MFINGTACLHTPKRITSKKEIAITSRWKGKNQLSGISHTFVFTLRRFHSTQNKQTRMNLNNLIKSTELFERCGWAMKNKFWFFVCRDDDHNELIKTSWLILPSNHRKRWRIELKDTSAAIINKAASRLELNLLLRFKC